MPDQTPDSPAVALTHEGWNHLKRQRPLAARASWLRALRIDPDQVAARDALELLTHSPDLPREARVEPKLRSPVTDARRKGWDKAFRTRDLSDLTLAAETFARLVEEDPDDADAWYNQGLGLAWLGRNVEAIEALERSVALNAWHDPAKAVGAWTLAELLRQGGGAEDVADDLTYTLQMTGDAVSEVGFVRWLEGLPQVQPAALPGLPQGAHVSIWLDRVPPDEPIASPSDVPRVLAYLVLTKGLLKLSSPDAVGLEPIKDEVEMRAGATFSREASPLSLTLLDAAVWAVMVPTDLPPEDQARMRRGVVEHFYEDLWIVRPRQGLDGQSPLELAKRALGDPKAKAKLMAVVAFREQLAERTSAVDLYQGYPFDRLRRRLGLPLRDTAEPGFEPGDATCMSPAELDALDPASLNDSQLADACGSAIPLGDDARSARFAEALANRGPKALRLTDRKAVFAVLVRRALAEEGPSRALAWLEIADQAEQALNSAGDRRVFASWKAEVFARADDPDEATRVYLDLLDEYIDDPELPLEAAEMFLAHDFPDQSMRFARIAADRADAIGDYLTSRLARRLLGDEYA